MTIEEAIEARDLALATSVAALNNPGELYVSGTLQASMLGLLALLLVEVVGLRKAFEEPITIHDGSLHYHDGDLVDG